MPPLRPSLDASALIVKLVLELPLHQIGIAMMGLVLLGWPRLTDLLAAAAQAVSCSPTGCSARQ
jgi:hypothetical protein